MYHLHCVQSYKFSAIPSILLLIFLFIWVILMWGMSQFCNTFHFFVLLLRIWAETLLMARKILHFLTDQAYRYGYYFSSVSCSITNKYICHIQVRYLCSLPQYQSFSEAETGFWASSYADKNRICNLSQVFAETIPAMVTTLKTAGQC